MLGTRRSLNFFNCYIFKTNFPSIPVKSLHKNPDFYFPWKNGKFLARLSCLLRMGCLLSSVPQTPPLPFIPVLVHSFGFSIWP